MTVKELSKLYHLNREVALNRKQLEKLEADFAEAERALAELRATMGDCSAPAPSDEAHGSAGLVSSPVENAVLRLCQMESELERKRSAILNLQIAISTRQTLCLLEQQRLEEYINGIDDSLLRQIFTHRFVNGCSWEEVAEAVHSRTVDSVKKACYRYLRSPTEKTA